MCIEHMERFSEYNDNYNRWPVVKWRFKCVFRDRNDIDRILRLALFSRSFPRLVMRSTLPSFVMYLLKLLPIISSWNTTAFSTSSERASFRPVDVINLPDLMPRMTKWPFSIGTKSSWAYSEVEDQVDPSLVEMVTCNLDMWVLDPIVEVVHRDHDGRPFVQIAGYRFLPIKNRYNRS